MTAIVTRKEQLVHEIETTLQRLAGLCDQLRGHCKSDKAQRRATQILQDYAKNAAAYNRRPLQPFRQSMRDGLHVRLEAIAAADHKPDAQLFSKPTDGGSDR